MNEIWNYQYLVEKYMDTVYRVALNYVKNPNDADDITQNTMIKLFSYKKEFLDEKHIKYWLIRVAINECKSYRQSFWHRNITGLSDYIEPIQFSEPEQSNLYYAVMNLPEKYRIVIYLYYYEDYSISEISSLVSCSKTAIQTRLMRGRVKLKEKLGGEWSND